MVFCNSLQGRCFTPGPTLLRGNGDNSLCIEPLQANFEYYLIKLVTVDFEKILILILMLRLLLIVLEKLDKFNTYGKYPYTKFD